MSGSTLIRTGCLIAAIYLFPMTGVLARDVCPLKTSDELCRSGEAVAGVPSPESDVRLSVTNPMSVTIPEDAEFDVLVFVNFDHNGIQAADKSDCEDEIINGPEDRKDMAAVTLENLEESVRGDFRLIVDRNECLRFFDENDNSIHFSDDDGYPLGRDRLRKDNPLVFLVEGVKPGVVNVVLRRIDPTGNASSESAIRIVVGVEILLTFDDGPLGNNPIYRVDGDPVSGPNPENSTAVILETLRDAGNTVHSKNIKACFFIISDEQSDESRNGASLCRDEICHPVRGGEPYGREILLAEEHDGHIFGYHRVTGQGYAEGPNTGLQNDIAAFKAHMIAAGLPAPLFVRPPNWIHDHDIDAVYTAEHLGLIMTDIRARDGGFIRGNSKAWVFVIRRIMRKGTRDRIREGMGQIVCTLHDVNRTTAENLPRYLLDALEGARATGLPEGATVFVNDTTRLVRLLDMKAKKGLFAFNPSAN